MMMVVSVYLVSDEIFNGQSALVPSFIFFMRAHLFFFFLFYPYFGEGLRHFQFTGDASENAFSESSEEDNRFCTERVAMKKTRGRLTHTHRKR